MVPAADLDFGFITFLFPDFLCGMSFFIAKLRCWGSGGDLLLGADSHIADLRSERTAARRLSFRSGLSGALLPLLFRSERLSLVIAETGSLGGGVEGSASEVIWMSSMLHTSCSSSSRIFISLRIFFFRSGTNRGVIVWGPGVIEFAVRWYAA